jgi:hypothetical protein
MYRTSPDPGRRGRCPEHDDVLVKQGFEASVVAVRAILAAERLRRKLQPGLGDFVQQFRAVRKG